MPSSLQLHIKRLFDIVVCGLLLVLGSPLLLILGLLVKWSSPGPVFFVQARTGRDEAPFRMIKFRTMSGSPDEKAATWTKSDELRITPIGRILRDFGLDELPQVLNILKGEMSIIGPRPPLPEQAAAFTPHLKRMFAMRPGVLSLAAIAGRRSLTMMERYALHVEYVETWSLKLDFKILWRSLFVVLKREAAAEKLPGE